MGIRYPSLGLAMGSASAVKVLLLIPHLGGGGAEHVAATLALYLSREKYEVHLGLVTQCPSAVAKAAEQFPPSVRIHPLGARRVRGSAWRILTLVWRVRPHVILSGMAHLNLLVLLLLPLFPSGTRVLVRQNGTLAATLEAAKLTRLSRHLFRMAYRRAHRVICQTDSMSDELRSVLGIDPGRLVVLPNPVDISGIRASIAQDDTTRQLPGPLLLTVGRLAPEKGLDLLLQAFARIKGKFPSAALRLAGTGPCESALKAQCSVLGISDCVQFVGQVASPAHLSGGYAAFVLASRHEGLPNALLEAAAAGLPIVATPASRGLADLLRDRPGVWLASDVSAEGLEQALLEALTTLGPGERFHHAWIDAFDRRVAIRAYEDEIDRSLLGIRT
jgi:glycosyltransferase involved in cell wall biosynthesis